MEIGNVQPIKVTPPQYDGVTNPAVQPAPPKGPRTVSESGASQKSRDEQQDGKGDKSRGAAQRPLSEVVEEVNKTIQQLARSLELSIDKDTGTTVIKVKDKDTGEVVRQIPSEEMLELAKRLDEFKGLLTSQKV
ncbi:flagellar protein FlaG [Leeia aquatica]|uniref:Flagellar protein FlaG n=1 Tax=Leeia aquatica TaxID=2725557 RepID=A0A847RTQ6_9NEIS|nr:flagellar protein FlaG [Leeia aquatica]NLR74590.1 flagellar protein FlaG [Leeia aquatica]